MACVTRMLVASGVIKDKWIADSVVYETVTGSQAYGCATPESDWDLYSVVIPPIVDIFPHLRGEVEGFGSGQTKAFGTTSTGKQQVEGVGEVELTIYGLVKYMQLLAECNPNMIDTLFTSQEMVKASTGIGTMLRENRHLFLHKRAWHTFKGYAYKQMTLIGRRPSDDSVRAASYDKYGFDVKYAMHLVRLLLEVEMILVEGDLDLMRHKEHLRSIRNGEIGQDDIRRWATSKEKDLETAYANSRLQYGADWPKLKRLLLACIELHYGSLSKFGVVDPGADRLVLQEIYRVLVAAGVS